MSDYEPAKNGYLCLGRIYEDSDQWYLDLLYSQNPSDVVATRLPMDDVENLPPSENGLYVVAVKGDALSFLETDVIGTFVPLEDA